MGSEAFQTINSWIDLETRFLYRFYQDDTEMTMDKLLLTVQEEGESVRKYIERFCNFSLMYPAGMPLSMFAANMSAQLPRQSRSLYGSRQSLYLEGACHTNRDS